jgi:hypothetical protein
VPRTPDEAAGSGCRPDVRGGALREGGAMTRALGIGALVAYNLLFLLALAYALTV